MLFSENVDYQDMDDFIRGVLVDEEIHGNTVYIHIDEIGYASRVSNPMQYDAISRDMLNRWIYPVTPDRMLDFVQGKSNIYIHKNQGIEVNHDKKMQKNVIVGDNAKLGTNVTLKDSVIGANCKIGNNVKLDGAYLWDNVVIEDNCSLRSSIIAKNVLIKHNTIINEACLIAENCIVGPNVNVAKGTLLHSKPTGKQNIDKRLVGAEGKAYIYRIPAESENEEENLIEIWGNPNNLGDRDLSSSDDDLGSQDENDSDADDDVKGKL